jgi:hypothetical protein
MTDLTGIMATLPEREQLLCLRAVLHCTLQELPVWAQFSNHVTDLDAARLIHSIERGALYVPSSTHDGWASLAPTRGFPHLTRVVNECLRLRLVKRVTAKTGSDVWRTMLGTAPVHLEAGINRPACGESGSIRFRLTDDIGLIDCQACLALDR